MTKNEFIASLSEKLSGFAPSDVKKALEYYSEIIDDQIENGVPESEAVASLGSADSVVRQIILEMPLPKIIHSKMKLPAGASVLKIIAITFGALLFFPIVIALAASVFAAWVSILAAAIAVCTIPIVLGAVGIAGIAACPFLLFDGAITTGLFALGAALISLGLVYPFYVAAKYSIIYTLKLGKLVIISTKKCFVK